MDSRSFFSQGYVRVLITLIMVAVLAALSAYAYLTLREARYANNIGPTTIQVQGEGEVLARPDIGEFSFAVRAEGDTAAAAQETSAEAINEIVSYLEEAGIAEADIKTQNYNLNPQYRYEAQACPPNSYCPPGERILDGFEVSQMIVVKVRDITQAGDLISGVGDRGATNISNLRFTIDDEDALLAQARAEAIADAKQKADALADALDVEIVRMIGYWEDHGPMPYYTERSSLGMGGEEAMDMVAPAMPTGENEYVRTVNITYEISD